MSDVIGYTWQFCRGGNDITTQFYAAEDADMARAWEDDFCLLEVTKQGESWVPTGGDGDWVGLAERMFPDHISALDAYAEYHRLTLAERD
jgi:hypothetical protein